MGEQRKRRDRGEDEVRDEERAIYLKKGMDMESVRVAEPWKCASHAAELMR